MNLYAINFMRVLSLLGSVAESTGKESLYCLDHIRSTESSSSAFLEEGSNFSEPKWYFCCYNSICHRTIHCQYIFYHDSIISTPRLCTPSLYDTIWYHMIPLPHMAQPHPPYTIIPHIIILLTPHISRLYTTPVNLLVGQAYETLYTVVGFLNNLESHTFRTLSTLSKIQVKK